VRLQALLRRPDSPGAVRASPAPDLGRHLDDPAPIQDDCPCLACRRFSRAYVAHLFRAKELLGYRLATCHNLTFTLDFMARIRAALRAGTFPVQAPDLRARAVRMSGGEGAAKPA
jgi:queuine tRNA-ribosyltransferase